MILTVNDYDIEFARVLAKLEAEGYTCERKQYGETVVYMLIGDGLEYGRWTIAPPRGREKHVQLMSHATAISRGCDTSLCEHGDMEHLPEEERARNRVFAEAERDIMAAIEFAHGLGDWADFWREHDAQHAAQAEPTDKDAPKVGAPRLSDLDDVQAADKKEKLREYLRYIHHDNRAQGFAAGKVGPARTTLERYRDQWPEVETGVKTEGKAEIEAWRAQKVRKV